MDDLRVAYVLQEDTWNKIDFRELKRGDIFKMNESTGEPAHDGDVWKAMGDPYESIANNKVWTIQTELYMKGEYVNG